MAHPASRLPHPPPSRLRWATLFLCCVVLFGSYYCYDNPAALHDQLRARLVPWAVAPGAFEYEFGLLYTAYSAPNVVLPLLGGLVSVISRIFISRISRISRTYRRREDLSFVLAVVACVRLRYFKRSFHFVVGGSCRCCGNGAKRVRTQAEEEGRRRKNKKKKKTLKKRGVKKRRTRTRNKNKKHEQEQTKNKC